MMQSDSLRPAIITRARIVLACAAGETNVEIAEQFSLSKATVGKWRQRFLEMGCGGLYDRPRPGKPPACDKEMIAALYDKMLSRPTSPTSNPWSIRALAKETGLPRSSVHRYLQQIKLQHCLSDSESLFGDPLSLRKAPNVIGLYLNPPDNALILGIEKPSAQSSALHALGGSIPGNIDDKDISILTAELNIASRMPKQKSIARQRHYELLDFFKRTKESIPESLEIHVIANNGLMCAHPRVRHWIATQHGWFTHMAQAPEVWLYVVEQVFRDKGKNNSQGKIIMAKEIVNRIGLFEAKHGKNTRPFLWTKSFGNFL